MLWRRKDSVAKLVVLVGHVSRALRGPCMRKHSPRRRRHRRQARTRPWGMHRGRPYNRMRAEPFARHFHSRSGSDRYRCRRQLRSSLLPSRGKSGAAAVPLASRRLTSGPISCRNSGDHHSLLTHIRFPKSSLTRTFVIHRACWITPRRWLKVEDDRHLEYTEE